MSEVNIVSEVNFAGFPPEHRLVICVTCAKPLQSKEQSKEQGKDAAESGGQRLLERLNRYPDWQLRDRFQIQPAKCMGVCSRECAIALSCAGKTTYLFGDLPTDQARLAATTEAVLACASQYHDQPDGVLAYRDRPELFKTGLVARIPV